MAQISRCQNADLLALSFQEMTLEELDEQEDENWDDDRLLEQIRYTETLTDSRWWGWISLKLRVKELVGFNDHQLYLN